MSVRQFDHLPDITELMPSGGRVGFDYALIASSNILRAQREGWDTVVSQPAFEVVGPMGSTPVMLMGKGEAILGGSSGASRARVWLDPAVSDATGLWLKGEEPVKETVDGQGKEKVQVQETSQVAAKQLVSNKGNVPA